LKNRPLILDIKGNSLDDGPGIRSVVFFKGCPLDCVWCQNPESKRAAPELMRAGEKCVGCGACVEVCPEKAVSPDNTGFIDRARCTLCFKCVDECPSIAFTRAGVEKSIDEIVKEVTRFKGFFDETGGGVTLSGGEPLLYMDFASELLKRLKVEGINTLIETCGLFDMKKFESLILPYTDIIYMDIKFVDPGLHKKYCGVSNDRILENFKILNARCGAGNFKLVPRTPLIPGITDGDGEIKALAAFYNVNGVTATVLLPNNPIWLEKLEKLGMTADIGAGGRIREFYSEEDKKRVVRLFEEKGISVHFG